MPSRNIDFKHNMAKLQGGETGKETSGKCENPALEGGKGPSTNPALSAGKGSGDACSLEPTSGNHSMKSSYKGD